MIQPKSYIIAHQSSRVVSDCVQSLQHHGWPYEIFPAVDGYKITEKDWVHIGVQMSKDGKMSRRPGAQGCWHSHFALWKRCIEIDQPILILEHDVVILEPWPKDINIDTQLVKLYSSAACKLNPTFGIWSKGSHAYSITPVQAQTLITHAQQHGAQAVDKHLGNRVLPWIFYKADLVKLNPRRGPSSTS